MPRSSIHLTVTTRLRARVEAAAKVEGITAPEYYRRAALAAVERTEQLAARRARQGQGPAKPGRR